MTAREVAKAKIFDLIKEYADNYLYAKPSNNAKIEVGFPCYDYKELVSAVDSLLDLRLSQGKKVEQFENDFRNYIGVKYGIAVNSGSSANLLALAALLKAGKIKSGCEVIVPAATFTTVVSPILQNGLLPTFVDVDSNTYNIDPAEVKRAINKKTGLIMVVHSLGCPADIDEIMKIANEKGIPVMEDCCEAHGASVRGKKVGSFGLISTYSFFVAHNITTGEGGMILTDDENLSNILRSMREFGRLRNVDPAKPRFHYNDELLKDYDERYVFENIGYNVRMTEIAASMGIEQVKKLYSLNKTRVDTAKFYTNRLKKYDAYLQLPIVSEEYFHSYYGYPILIRDGAPFSRTTLVRYLESEHIETRAFMGGNLSVQPAYKNEKIKVIGNLLNSNLIMNNAFFIGCHSQITETQKEHVVSTFNKFFEKYLKVKNNDLPQK